MYKAVLTILSILIICSSAAIGADIPKLVNVQGKLTDNAGVPVSDGDHSVTFCIYGDSTGGSSLWCEPRTVPTTGGLFSTILGQVTPLSTTVFSAPNRWLGLAVDGGVEMVPRQRFTSVPFAYVAATADSTAGGAARAMHSLLADSTVGGAARADKAKWADSSGCGWVDKGSRVITRTTSDSVAIGIATPYAKLQVEGTISFQFDYNSGWQSISQGETLVLNHNLAFNADSLVVLVDGKNSNGIHQANYGTIPSNTTHTLWRGLEWHSLTSTQIKLTRGNDDNQGTERDWDQVRVRIIKRRQ